MPAAGVTSAMAIDEQVWQQHAWLNRLQSLALLLFMGAYLGLLGWLLAGPSGLAALLVSGAIAVMINPAAAPHWVMHLYRARRLSARDAPALLELVATLGRRAALPAIPALYYVPSETLNAFAVGHPRRSAIAVTDGLLRRLDLRKLAGVLAHETSHIRSNDLWVMGLADMCSRATSLLSLFGQLLLIVNLPLLLFGELGIDWWLIALLVVAPTVSAMAQLALSRTREFDADLNAARLTGDPDGLAAALARIERIQGGWMERVFLPGRGIPDPSLLRTHPQTGDRIARLQALKRQIVPDATLPWMHAGDTPLPGPPVERRPRWHSNGLWH